MTLDDALGEGAAEVQILYATASMHCSYCLLDGRPQCKTLLPMYIMPSSHIRLQASHRRERAS